MISCSLCKGKCPDEVVYKGVHLVNEFLHTCVAGCFVGVENRCFGEKQFSRRGVVPDLLDERIDASDFSAQ